LPILPAFLGYYQRYVGYGFWAVVERSTVDFVGWFQFRPADGHPVDEPELGYRLRKSVWGKGYATEGSLELIRRGSTELGVRLVVAETMVAHTSSRRVMEKPGCGLLGPSTRTGPTPYPATSSTRSHGRNGSSRQRRGRRAARHTVRESEHHDEMQIELRRIRERRRRAARTPPSSRGSGRAHRI